MHLLSVISKSGRGYIRDRNHHDKLQRIAATSSNRQLQQTLQAGIAFHNAGMEASERAQVEELFLARDVLVRQLQHHHLCTCAYSKRLCNTCLSRENLVTLACLQRSW